jgi:putative transposase
MEAVPVYLTGRPKIAINFVLSTGIKWNALPRELGASSTVHDRWKIMGTSWLLQSPLARGLFAYDELTGIEWEWQAVDGVMTRAPFGHAATGKHPTDRGKQGVKRSLLTDGSGIPLAIVVDGANRHDIKPLCATLEGIVIARPAPSPETPQHLCLDAGYDYLASLHLACSQLIFHKVLVFG